MGGIARRVIMIAVLVLAVGAGWWQLHHLQSSDDKAQTVSGDPGVALYPEAKGVPVPPIEGTTLGGDRLSLKDLRGHVVVLNMWGSWCSPCRAEAPDLAKVSAATKARGVRFVGIDVRDNAAAAGAFTRNFGIKYPSLEDNEGDLLAEFNGIIPVSAVPSTLIIDAEGVIRARVVGGVDAGTLRGLITDAEKGS